MCNVETCRRRRPDRQQHSGPSAADGWPAPTRRTWRHYSSRLDWQWTRRLRCIRRRLAVISEWMCISCGKSYGFDQSDLRWKNENPQNFSLTPHRWQTSSCLIANAVTASLNVSGTVWCLNPTFVHTFDLRDPLWVDNCSSQIMKLLVCGWLY